MTDLHEGVGAGMGSGEAEVAKLVCCGDVHGTTLLLSEIGGDRAHELDLIAGAPAIRHVTTEEGQLVSFHVWQGSIQRKKALFRRVAACLTRCCFLGSPVTGRFWQFRRHIPEHKACGRLCLLDDGGSPTQVVQHGGPPTHLSPSPLWKGTHGQ